ncbi:MAG: ATPase [Desulfurococcales archaeon ex4484_204]|nr:MAG: ATPase [Desulfurococcales archaeon ex4484_204]
MRVTVNFVATLGLALGLAGGLAGSSIGTARAASAGLAVLAEEPGYFRQVIILAALPMTQTFYGLIFTLLGITAVLPSIPTLTDIKGWAFLGIGIAVFLAEFVSAWMQGVVCMSGIIEIPKTKGGIWVHTMILASYVELFGILGLVFGYLMLTLVAGLTI